jgi:predicted phosphate transport protein (TIGR00153 family)
MRMFRMTQRETAFFDVFEAASEIAYQSAVILQDLVLRYDDPDASILALEAKEHEGDQQVHAMMDRLNRSFITPMDREDLFAISKDLDNITDCIESTAHLFSMFDVRTVKDDAKAFVKLIVEATAELHALTKEMKRFKKSVSLKTKVIEINRLENEGDRLHRRAVHTLFTQEKDPLEVLKWRDVYENLEGALDACEHVANIILGAVVKHA